jgi:hypothetical protein
LLVIQKHNIVIVQSQTAVYLTLIVNP